MMALVGAELHPLLVVAEAPLLLVMMVLSEAVCCLVVLVVLGHLLALHQTVVVPMHQFELGRRSTQLGLAVVLEALPCLA